ncbi:antitoxin Xre/MbcA/ParS toxin-binding domain-containing protein [Tranquillimonas alkanivorans]|uniref:Antitoxin Xre/MbcA/ParS-like toxin-binding domain-containing protein n=1 Tax=Tranquillimonas alkanivorans TaxID=441119 RepID=A0A1I5WD48_9RHOB|nr:antitoxin Xre/MbcA/ParS toxin-binding domain-containing protein [Tranquillimonas alkanivorans]SFQ17669.1 Protein of unknown function [Tranquillimonas alkanivorans]
MPYALNWRAKPLAQKVVANPGKDKDVGRAAETPDEATGAQAQKAAAMATVRWSVLLCVMKYVVPTDPVSAQFCSTELPGERVVIIDAIYDGLIAWVQAAVDRSPEIDVAATDVGQYARRCRAAGDPPRSNTARLAVDDFLSSETGLKRLLDDGHEVVLVHEDRADLKILNRPPSLTLVPLHVSDGSQARSAAGLMALRKLARGDGPSRPETTPAPETQTETVAVKAVVRISERWSLSDEQVAALLRISPEDWLTKSREPHGAAFTEDQMLRMSALVGVYRLLHEYFSADLANRWITLPNDGPLFRGARPVDMMETGGLSSMVEVRRYLEDLIE